ncbi:MAG: O-antigen ligase family protein [Clostridia bacterium]|nr:O-antigen ligase family protein [Clostridia bacterium]
MKKTNTKDTSFLFLLALIFMFPFLKGMHDTLTVIIMAAIMIVAIIIKSRKNKCFKYSLDFNFIVIIIWSLSYLISSFYAIDKGMALLGALKMLSIPIFLLLYFQYDMSNEKKIKIHKYIAYSGSIMTIASLLFSIIPTLREFFFVSNRLHGFFLYANTFGIWLLIGVIILLFQEKLTKLDIASLILSIIGIVLTNSRAIIILTILAFIVSFFFTKLNKKFYGTLLLSTIIIGIILIFLLNSINISSRLENMVSSSEFMTRFLYYYDAAIQIMKHPFGLGHQGWWTIQSTIQTGVYDCQYVHNAPLQIMLDVGIIPCLLLIILIFKTLFDKKVSAMEKVILLFILAHAMIDFDFEFLAIVYLIVLMPNYNIQSTTSKTPQICLFVLLAINLYFVFPLSFFEVNMNELAYKLYPNYTFALRKELLLTDDTDLKLELASRANNLDKYSYDIYDALYNVALENGDTEEAYKNIRKVTEANKYSMLAHIQYLNFLETAMYEYMDSYDDENTKLYMERIIEVEEMIQRTLDKTNPLAFNVGHVPLLTIPEEIQAFIDEVKTYYYENY